MKKKINHSALINIVIPVFNRFDLLKRCLNAIPEASKDNSYLVTIIDNASTDEIRDDFYRELRKDNKHIFIVKNKKNMGFPKACNLGAKSRTCRFIFFLNSDVILYPDSIDNAIRMMMDDADIGAAGFKLLFFKDHNDPIRPPGKIQHVGMALDIRADPVHLFVGWGEDNPRIETVRDKDLFAVTGAALLTRRRIFNKVGGFDENFGKGTWEDVDYCLTLQGLGYKIRVCLDAVGEHFVGGSSTQNDNFPLMYNKQLFIEKHKERIQWNEWAYV